jgi:hypothetical protein
VYQAPQLGLAVLVVQMVAQPATPVLAAVVVHMAAAVVVVMPIMLVAVVTVLFALFGVLLTHRELRIETVLVILFHLWSRICLTFLNQCTI